MAMTDLNDLKTNLLKIEGNGGFDGDSYNVTSWPRNPDGSEAVAKIERLERELAEAKSEMASLGDAIILVREVLDAAGVPTAGFIDDHVKNLVVMLKEERQRRAGGEPATTIIMARELRTARSRIAELDRERDEWIEIATAHEAKWRAICKHADAECGCSYDRVTDVCAAHSPALMAAKERIETLERDLLAKTECANDLGREVALASSRACDVMCERNDARRLLDAALARVAEIDRELAFLRSIDLRKLLDAAEARVAELEAPPTDAQIEVAKSEFSRVIHSDMIHLGFDEAMRAALDAAQRARMRNE